MGVRSAAFVIWAAVAATAVFWSARLLTRPASIPAYATIVEGTATAAGDLGRVLGVEATQPSLAPVPRAADARFRLVGVVAPRAPGTGGVALIASNDNPAKAYRVGATVDGDLVLQSVHARGAVLGAAGQPAQVTLELPALPPPRVGVPGAGASRPSTAAPPSAGGIGPIPSRAVPIQR